mgnify:FL=1
MGLNIVLVEPEIPQNTGNIARTCAITNSKLHLVKPLGFDLDEKQARRAGLDYWPYASVETHENLNAFFEKYRGCRFFYASTKAKKYYTEVEYKDGDYILFGKETAGLPEELIFGNPDTAIKIPMDTERRSLNLSNAVAIIAYEALRQLDFLDLT